jgi:hypothetical protein
MNLQLSANDLKLASTAEIIVGAFALTFCARCQRDLCRTALRFGVEILDAGTGGLKSSKPAHSTSSFCRRCGAWRGCFGLLPNRNKRSVWSIGSQPFKEAHFATFPPALIEPCILAGCPVGGIVLDPFAGAGTTGLVAALKGRNSILIEKNRKYAKMAKARIAKHGPRGCLVRLVDGAAYDFGVAIPAAEVQP